MRPTARRRRCGRVRARQRSNTSERATLAARRLRDPELDEAIRSWEERLAPLAEAIPEIESPRDLLPEIEARIRCASAEAPGGAAIVMLERSMRRWRTVAIAASVLAGVLAIGFVAREGTRQSAPREYVAILRKDAASPAIEVTVNFDKQELTVRPVAAQAPPGKAYELWIIEAKLGAPRSLGLIGDTPRGASLSAYDPAVVAGATYAVTVEPRGGSPDGKTVRPIFVGKLIPVGRGDGRQRSRDVRQISLRVRRHWRQFVEDSSSRTWTGLRVILRPECRNERSAKPHRHRGPGMGL
jgi:anti-sigma-K factor RskA